MYEGTYTKRNYGTSVESALHAARFMSGWHQRWSIFWLRSLEPILDHAHGIGQTSKHPWVHG